MMWVMALRSLFKRIKCLNTRTCAEQCIHPEFTDQAPRAAFMVISLPWTGVVSSAGTRDLARLLLLRWRKLKPQPARSLNH